MPKKECSVVDCGRKHAGHGYCDMHLGRLRRTGRLHLRTAEEKFWAKVERTSTCWWWRGTLYPNGYGAARHEGRVVMAHRRAYELLVGSIPDRRDIDHLCRNTACVNPDHLEPVTHQTNVLRGMSPSALACRSNACQAGHQFTEANTYVDPAGKRNCRTCKNARWRARYRRERESA